MQRDRTVSTRAKCHWPSALPQELNASHHALYASSAAPALRNVVEDSMVLDVLEDRVRQLQDALSAQAAEAVANALPALRPGHQAYWRRVLKSGEALTALLAWQDAGAGDC